MAAPRRAESGTGSVRFGEREGSACGSVRFGEREGSASASTLTPGQLGLELSNTPGVGFDTLGVGFARRREQLLSLLIVTEPQGRPQPRIFDDQPIAGEHVALDTAACGFALDEIIFDAMPDL